jgi:hypothetical protein
MNNAPVVSMDALWPELAGQRRPFEVVVTVPRADGGAPLVPLALPPEVLGCWSAGQFVASVTVLAARPSTAVAVAEALVPELARAAGAVVTVRAAGAAELARPGAGRLGADPPARAVAVAADDHGELARPGRPGSGPVTRALYRLVSMGVPASSRCRGVVQSSSTASTVQDRPGSAWRTASGVRCGPR